MNKTNIFVLSSWKSKLFSKDQLSKKWSELSFTKWEEIQKLIWTIWDATTTIISSPNYAAVSTAEAISKWMWLSNIDINKIDNLKVDTRYEWDIDKTIELIKQFISSNLLVIIIAHFSKIETVALKLWYEWKLIKRPYEWDWYHFTIEQQKTSELVIPKEFNIWEKINPLEDVILEIWEEIMLWTRKLIRVKLQNNGWIVLDQNTREPIYIRTKYNFDNWPNEYRIITKIWKPWTDWNGNIWIFVEFNYNGHSNWILINPQTLDIIQYDYYDKFKRLNI